jgi:hypothetical protein
MSIHCAIDDSKAVIAWQWSGENEKKYESKTVPVQVEVKPVNTQGESNMGTWSMRTYDNFTLPPGNPFSYRGTATESPVTANIRTIQTAGTNRIIYQDSSISAGNIQYSNILFTPDLVTKYQIIISDTNGNQLFKDEKTSDTPPKYNVACGDGCPPNHIKCKCDSYPGYCCIPCNEIKGGIAAATAAVRGINRG